MQCDICSRAHGSNLPFLCSTDARNCLYEHRIQHTLILLEKDSLEQQVTTALSKNGTATGNEASMASADIKTLRAETEHTLDRTQQIILKADELREKVEKAREEIARKKAMINRRSSDLVSASQGIEAWRNKQIEDVEKSIGVTRSLWHQKHASTASARAFLCAEAAKLYGLKKIRQKSSKDEYYIGGIPIPDLRKLNTALPAQISTALSHSVHLLILSAHYLGLRLPAEITLPHRDYPLPTIFSLKSSYKFSNLPFPSNTSTSTNPHGSSNLDQNHLARPRPLYLRKPLSRVAAEDQVEYLLFLEGISLLAYDIAWVCKTQGISLGEEGSFRNIFDVGRNLFNLLLGARPVLPLGNRLYSEDRVTSNSPFVGKYSHSAAHSFLGSTEGTNLIRSWKLLSPIKLADRLRSQLTSEASNAEWEILDADAWAADDDEIASNKIVLNENQKEERPSQGLDAESFVSI